MMRYEETKMLLRVNGIRKCSLCGRFLPYKRFLSKDKMCKDCRGVL